MVENTISQRLIVENGSKIEKAISVLLQRHHNGNSTRSLSNMHKTI